MNEIRLGVRSKAPEKPDFLASYEMYKKFGALPYEGGMADQPWIWVMEYMLIESEVEFMELLNTQAERQNKE